MNGVSLPLSDCTLLGACARVVRGFEAKMEEGVGGGRQSAGSAGLVGGCGSRANVTNRPSGGHRRSQRVSAGSFTVDRLFDGPSLR